MPDPVAGTLVKAFVVLHPGQSGDEATAAALRDHVLGRIAPYKAPKGIEFLDGLPKNSNGKILRQLESARAESGETGGSRF